MALFSALAKYFVQVLHGDIKAILTIFAIDEE